MLRGCASDTKMLTGATVETGYYSASSATDRTSCTRNVETEVLRSPNTETATDHNTVRNVSTSTRSKAHEHHRNQRNGPPSPSRGLNSQPTNAYMPISQALVLPIPLIPLVAPVRAPMLLGRQLPLLRAALAIFVHGPHPLQRLDSRADMAGLAPRVMAVREAPVASMPTAVNDELEVAHGCFARSQCVLRPRIASRNMVIGGVADGKDWFAGLLGCGSARESRGWLGSRGSRYPPDQAVSALVLAKGVVRLGGRTKSATRDTGGIAIQLIRRAV